VAIVAKFLSVTGSITVTRDQTVDPCKVMHIQALQFNSCPNPRMRSAARRITAAATTAPSTFAACRLASLLLALAISLSAAASQAAPAAAELALLAPVAGSGAADDDTRRFLDAEKALAHGRVPEFRRLARRLEHYPLYPYLVYDELRRRLGKAGAAEVSAFLAGYADTPLSERLRRRWLNVLARRGEWNAFLRFWNTDESRIELRCRFLQALLNTGQRESAFAQVPDVWLSGDSRPKACDPVFRAWRDAGRLTRDLVWERIALAMDRGNPGLARYLSRYLPAKERPLADQWIVLRRAPHGVRKIPQETGDPLYERMHAYALKRLARKDAAAAAALWSELTSGRAYAAETSNQVYREIGLAYARAGEPEGGKWLEKIPPEARDEQSHHWYLANTVLHGRWRQALDGFRSPATGDADAQQRRYWRARALEALGRQDEARVLYQDLARERHFYGFLAADRIGAPYAFGNAPLPASDAALVALASAPAAQRIRLLRSLGRTLDSRREWYYWIDTLDDAGRALAAKLAQRWGWHDAGILTVARTPHRDDLVLRFPLAYAAEAASLAASLDLEPAMVLALIRQESAFMADATSPRGARGLMQILPSTGHKIAHSLGTHLKRRSQLYDPATNLRLGTTYFRRMLDAHAANPVLALGAYNAGPRRVAHWRKQLPPADADVWVENITFSETREYVKRVLAYTAVYEHRLGLTPTALSERMGTISPP
jgi:soluble lytic murein transglycosylase